MAASSILLFALGPLGLLSLGELRVQEDWRWVTYGVPDGLPAANIESFVESTDGAIWAVWQLGVARFDGFSWETIGARSGLPAGRVRAISAGKNGEVWVLVPGGVYRSVRTESSTRFQRFEIRGLPKDDVRSLTFVAPDQLWVLTEKTAFRVKGGTATAISPPKIAPHLESLTFSHFATDADSPFVYTNHGWFRWDDSDWTPIIKNAFWSRHYAGGALFSVNDLPENRGLWEWSPSTGARRISESKVVLSFDVRSNGEALGVLASGAVLHRSGEIWTRLAFAPPRLSRATAMLYRDNGELWIATDQRVSLCRTASARWTRLDISGELLQVADLLRDSQRQLWVLSDDGVHRHDPADGTETVFQSLNDHTAIAESKSGRIYVGSGGSRLGVRYWDGTRWKEDARSDVLSSVHVHRIVPDRNRDLWFLTLRSNQNRGPENVEQGAFVLRDEEFEQWGPEQGLINGRVYTFVEDRTDARWFGTWGGLSRWKDGEWKHWTRNEGLRASKTFAVAESPDGTIFFGHHGAAQGLGYLDADENIQYIDARDGLTEASVWEIEPDPIRGIWLSTEGGVARYRDGVVSVFDASTGLEYLRTWPLVVDSESVLVGTTGGGVYRLDRDESRHPAPRVSVQTPVIEKSDVYVTWTCHPFRGETAEASTRYRLDGTQWSAWRARGDVRLRDLASGTHRIEVQSKSLFGNLSTPRSASFRIEPPFYRRTSFVAVIALSTFALVSLLLAVVANRRRVSTQKKQQEDLFRIVTAAATDGILTIDSSSIIRFANPATGAIFGVEPQDLIGTEIALLMPDGYRSRHRTALSNYLHSGEKHGSWRGIEMPGLRADGSIVPLEISFGESQRDGERLFVGVIRDTSERKRSEQQKKELESALHESQKHEAVGRLAGGIAHDFNNLLTAIFSHESLARIKVQNPSVLHHLDGIEEAGRRAANLTKQLLSYGRGSHAKPLVFSIANLVESMGTLLPRLIGEDIDLTIRTDDHVWPVEADPGQIEQVLVNLIVNGRDAMPGGGALFVSVSNECLSLGVGDLKAGDYVRVTVRDTGEGIRREISERIFEPFFTTKNGSGHGLGLATSYRIVRQCGGLISVESRAGEGSTFTLRFPRSHGEISRENSSAKQSPMPGGSESILLVEDETSVRDLISRSLTQLGYSVEVAENGEVGLESLQSDRHFDLLLTDVVMPKMGGRELAKRFQKL
ncbi:MAG: ATP-binding protein, partial [Planctomycetota bacterium]